MRNFRELEIRKKRKNLVKDIYRVSSTFPSSEQYGLINQINRSSVSIPSNIAEGCSRSSNKDFKRFIDIALGSAFELETQLIISKELNFVSQDNYSILMEKLNHLQRSINSYRNYLK